MERLIVPQSAHIVSSTDMAEINALLSASGMNTGDLRFTGYWHDSVVASTSTPNIRYDRKMIYAQQYIKGMPIWMDRVMIVFKNDVLQAFNGYFGDTTSLDTVPHLKTEQVRAIFLRDRNYFSFPANYKDSCFQAQFGFFRMSITSSQPNQLVKAWAISCGTNPNTYPFVYYQDDDGGKLLFRYPL